VTDPDKTPASARPRLASKARLHFDRHAQKHMLLYPERGMVLNETAVSILQLCTGEHTVEQIVERLHAASGGATREEVERDVQQFLDALRERALIQLG
jgi:pyrroloquinoline quinone biosynthesis protein D